jgi:hypothetical protein
MWDGINKDPLIKGIIIITIALIVLGFAFNIMFGSNYYSMMPSNGLEPQGLLSFLAKLLLFVSGIGFIISIIVCLIKDSGVINNNQKSEFKEDKPCDKVCYHCGFNMQDDWTCCPKCGNGAEKQEASAEKVSIKAPVEADREAKEVEQEEQNIIERVEKDDIVERLYQDDKNSYKKNNKRNKKNSSD